MNRETRNLQNSKQKNISDINYYPAEMQEGEILFAFPNGKLLRLYKKIRGMVWWLPFTRDGNYIFEGNVKVGGKINGIDINEQRAHLLFGYNAQINAFEETITEYAKTVDGVGNEYGYRMMRAGRVTGISYTYTCNSIYGQSELNAIVLKNGVATDVIVSDSPTAGAGKGSYNLSNTVTFVAGDLLSVEIELYNEYYGVTVSEFAIMVEIQYGG